MSAAYFEALISIAPDGVISIDESQRIALFNRGAELIFGYTADEVLGQPLILLLPESVRRGHQAHVEAFSASGVPARMLSERRVIHGRRKNGELFPAEASISNACIEGRSYYTAVVRDISERVQLDAKRQALFDQEHEARTQAERASARASLLARASTLLDASLDQEDTLDALSRVCVPELASLCVIDLADDGRVRRRVFVGPDAPSPDVARGLARYPKDSPRGFVTRPALIDGRSVLVRHVAEADLSDLAQDEEHLKLWRRVAPTSYMCAPLRAGDRIAGAIALVAGKGRRPYDAADLALLDEIASRASLAMENARLYDEARHATALRDDVLAIVSHDLRNPLATISMALGRLEAESDPTDTRHAELLGIARESAEWMQRMIQDLLDVASIDAGRLSVEPASADMVVVLVQAGTLFEQLLADQGIRFALDLPEFLPQVSVDQERILQLVGNLLSNAAKYTPAGGRITLSARDAGREIVVSVRDTGSGIPHNDVPHLFDRYWHARRTAKTRGTGLGLSIVKGIVDAHRGRLWVDTIEGTGSVFSFALPVPRESPRSA